MERPFFIPLVSMIAGLTSGLLTEWYVPALILLPLLPALICSLFIKSRIPFFLSMSMVFFCTANLSIEQYLVPGHKRPGISRYASEEPLLIEGVVDSRPEPTERGYRITLLAENVFSDSVAKNSEGRILLSVEEGKTDLNTGDIIRFSSRLKKPRNYGLPGEFDIERYMAFRNISATAFVKNGEEIIVIGASGRYFLQRRIDMIAKYLAEYISSNVSPNEATVLRALLLGDKGVVPEFLKNAYTRAGVNHILSISGFHVGIIAFFVFQILLLATRSSETLMLHFNMRRLSLICTVPVLIFYLYLSGAAPATVRSVIMILAYIIAMAAEREVDPIDTLMLAALIILASSPAALFDLSFQLSFLAIWGILSLTPILASPFSRFRDKVTGKIILFFFSSVAATAATIIPVAYYFHRTSAIGLISNFIIVPLLGYGAVVIGFSALPLVYLFPSIAKLLFVVSAFMVKASNNIILILAKMPMLPIFNPSKLELGISFLFLVAITFIKAGKIRKGCCLVLVLLYVCSSLSHSSPDKGRFSVTFFSVGQGESILVNFPEGKRMLIDGGGSPFENRWDVGEKLLAPALWKMGIDSLDYMVMTHPHPDHMQGLKFVAQNFRIGEFWEGMGYPVTDGYQELMEIVKSKKIPIRVINASSPPFRIGSVLIEPLAPFAETARSKNVDYHDLNEESMVFRVSEGRSSILFTGDIGREVETILKGDPGKLRCTVLKLPHHGSRKSSTMDFLRNASPSIAVASAGYGNSFHLPAEETIERLKALGIRLYRTDLDGTVQLIFDEKVASPVIVRKMGHFR